jgi:hypothetical protein
VSLSLHIYLVWGGIEVPLDVLTKGLERVLDVLALLLECWEGLSDPPVLPVDPVEALHFRRIHPGSLRLVEGMAAENTGTRYRRIFSRLNQKIIQCMAVVSKESV